MDQWDRVAAPLQRLSELAQRKDEERRLSAAMQARCGHCFWWMKSRNCPREHNVNGMTRGPDAGGTPCGKFESTGAHIEAVGRYYAFIAEPF